jgi:hypothetical protein
MKKLFFICLSLVLTLILISCNGGDDALFTGSEYAETISIDAHITHSLDSSSQRVKSDTLIPRDSVIFLVSVYPSKAIRLQNYFWKINEKKRGAEFSFRSAFENAGKQTVVFHLVDYYGDTLTDTLIIWVSNPPELNDSVFVPANESQHISSEKGISFIWNASDQDSNDPLKHHFRLFNNDSSFVDTIVYEPYFHYPYQLPPLHQIFWSVETFDSFNLKAPQKIESTFYTESFSTEDGAVVIPISAKNNSLYEKLDYIITPKENQPLPLYITEKENIFLNKGILHLSSLKEGAYEIEVFHSEYNDFKMKPLFFSIIKEEVLVLDSITLTDSIPPIISNLNSSSDTIPIQDSLSFSITDGGIPLTKNNIQVYFDSQLFISWSFSNSVISISIPKEKQNDFLHLLSFKITDFSSNVNKKTYYLSSPSNE